MFTTSTNVTRESIGPPRQAFAPPPMISYRDTRAAMNNQIAAGDRAAAQRVAAGQGLSQGFGQRSLQANRGAAARANAFGSAMGTRMDDAFTNAGAMANYQNNAASERLAYDSMDRTFGRGEMDSRFNNLTTIWGALSGLLR